MNKKHCDKCGKLVHAPAVMVCVLTTKGARYFCDAHCHAQWEEKIRLNTQAACSHGGGAWISNGTCNKCHKSWVPEISAGADGLGTATNDPQSDQKRVMILR